MAEEVVLPKWREREATEAGQNHRPDGKGPKNSR